MLAELKEIFNIIKDFCVDNYIELLLCVNTAALLLVAICLIRVTSGMKRKKKAAVGAETAEELLLSLNIKRADVNIGSINEGFERKPVADSAESAKDGSDESAEEFPQETESTAERNEAEITDTDKGKDIDGYTDKDKVKAEKPTETAVVIEKLIPTPSPKAKTAGFCTSRNGKVYSEEEILRQIKE